MDLITMSILLNYRKNRSSYLMCGIGVTTAFVQIFCGWYICTHMFPTLKLRCSRSLFLTPEILLAEAFTVAKEMRTPTNFDFLRGCHNLENSPKQYISLEMLHLNKHNSSHMNWFDLYYLQLLLELKIFSLTHLSRQIN